jgi:hypothetical protein
MAILVADKITLEDVARKYPPRGLLNYQPPKYNGAVMALGQAVYEATPQRAVDNQKRFIESVAREFAPGNLWLLPTYERMTFPYSAYWPLACAFHAEREQERRFDWYLWADDDAMFEWADVKALLDVAQEQGVLFISALPYDRIPPHQPSVMEKIDGKLRKWIKAPEKGSYPVALVGMLLCLFHRSIFEMVPEPWFGVCGPAKGFAGMAPDWWWCAQMDKAGLQPWVCCDTKVTHLGLKKEITREVSEAHLEKHGIPDCALHGKLESQVSGATKAVVIEPPIYGDGRTEQIQIVPTVERKRQARDWSESTVVILTCERHREMLKLCLGGIEAFWPGVKVAVLRDDDYSKDTELPEDVRAVVRQVPFLRKVFDMPFVSETDSIYCLDSDCLVFDEPWDWGPEQGLYVLPGTLGFEWLKKGNEVWKAIGQPEIRTDRIFCGGCWSASRKKMFEDTRDIAIAYVRECVKRGYHEDQYAGVLCEQCLLNGLWHIAHEENPLDIQRYPLDIPNPSMAILHLHMEKEGAQGETMLREYKRMLGELRGE